jgi:hypothetical protein
MNTTLADPAEVLERAKALAKTDSNLEMMDHVASLHGYIALLDLKPADANWQLEVADAAARLLEAAARHQPWHSLLQYDEGRPIAA